MHGRRFLIAVFVLLFGAAFGFAAALQTPEAQATVWQGQMIRLHVIARSDSETDQRIKLAVRDALIQAFGERLKAETYEAAQAAIQENLAEIQRLAQRTARELGEMGEIEVTFGPHDFPTRMYGDTVVPAGTYQALRVVIGGGAGRNWWCVMYPALCLTDADCPTTQQQALPVANAPQVAQEPQFTGALWGWLQSIF